MEIREKLSLFFKNNGITRKVIAEDNGVETSTVSHWFTGKRAMPLSLLVYAVQKHNLDASSLFENNIPTVVSESPAYYNTKKSNIEAILKDVEKSLNKHM